MRAEFYLLLSTLFCPFLELVRSTQERRLSDNLNNVIRKDYWVHVIHNCKRFPLEVTKQIAVPYSTWNSSGMQRLLDNVNTLQGFKADFLVACWEPSFGHLLTLAQSYDMPFLHVRWIFLTEQEVLSEASMSKTLQSVGCYGVFVAAPSSYVALDTYANCSNGVRRFLGRSDPAFEDRSLTNLTILRHASENSVPTIKDFRNRRLEPQTTIVESIIRKSKAIESTKGCFDKFGRGDKNFLFTGAVGAVQRKQKDLGSFEIYLTERIWYGLGIAGVARYDSLTFLSPVPKAITDLTIIGRPFTLPLWVAVWASLGVYLLLVVAIITAYSTGSAVETPDIQEECVELFFYLSSALVNHAPYVRLPRHSSARILVAFWFIFATIISAGFTGMLTSYTNFPPKTRPINTLEQLSDALEQKSVKLCIKNNHYYRDILSSHLLSRSSVLKDHLQESLFKIGCQTTMCCLEKVAKGTHVFVTNREEARFHTGKAYRGAVRAKEDFFLVHVVLIAPKASPYTRAFSDLSQRLMETGVSLLALKLVRGRNANRSRFRKTRTCRHQQGCCRPLQLKDLYGLLVVWAIGLTLGLVTLFCEIAWNGLHETRLRKGNQAATKKRCNEKNEKPSLSQVINPDKSTSLVIFGHHERENSGQIIKPKERRVFVSLKRSSPNVS
ncbi:hypothetical protein V5799_008048 [Amblyomma americanum]|uniref:Ionotropic glutamate receptor C-terminal domain-containing protein n=1 Tax=Amblyomma americanum TaxID=6943 RepID=A0AAQ4FED8_AMBAM